MRELSILSRLGKNKYQIAMSIVSVDFMHDCQERDLWTLKRQKEAFSIKQKQTGKAFPLIGYPGVLA